MKKFWSLLTVLVLCLSLCACDGLGIQRLFPEDTTLLSVDVTGMSPEEALATLESAVADYTLALTVDGSAVTVAGKDIDLSCDGEAFLAQAKLFLKREDSDFSQVIRYDEAKLAALLDAACNQKVQDAALSFDETAGQYVLIPHKNGQEADPAVLTAALAQTIGALEPSAELNGLTKVLLPKYSAEFQSVQDALAQANKMIGVRLSYNFNPDGTVATHQLAAETIRSFVTLDEDGITPIVDEAALQAYVAELDETYSAPGYETDFITTGGSTVGLTVAFNGQDVDEAALTEDIARCLRDGTSGARTAPYVEAGVPDMPYGGTYIEVDLTAQHLWFYSGGECIVSTDLVSGMVGAEMNTPTGVYSIYAKDTNTYLVGEDYRSYVNYWMPFSGGYGLHDATWRSSFGGEIYLYGGSHGCVNLPLDAAATIFNNCSVGTPVILYGGVWSVPRLDQKLSGTTSYEVADDAKAFALDIKAKYADPDFTYKSSDTKVATVSKDGTVTVKGVGTATITVKAEKDSCYAEAEKKVTVTVHSACDEGRHTMGKPKVTKKPTCESGIERTECKNCDHFTEKELEPTKEHSYGDWVITEEPTCAEDGTQERTCTVCKSVKETGTAPATGKHTEGKWETVREATCAEESKRQLPCKTCGEVLKEESVPVTEAHTAGDWQTLKEATCTEDGLQAKSCTVCGKELETQAVAAGHKAGKWEVVTPPTCTKTGSKIKACTVCGEELERKAVKKADHSYEGAACTVCGKADPDYTEPTEAPTEPTEAPTEAPPEEDN